MKKTLLLLITLGILFALSACRSGAEESLTITPTSTSVISESTEATLTVSPTPTVPPRREFERIMKTSPVAVVYEEGITSPSKAVIISKEQIVEIPGALDSTSSSGDGTVMAMLFDRQENETGRLVYFNGETVIAVDDQVLEYKMSDDGGRVVYLKSDSEDGDSGILYAYDCLSGETNMVAESANSDFVLSPSGKAVAYMVYETPENTDEWSIFCYVEGVGNQRRGEGLFPIALTDDGELVYAVLIERDADGEILNKALYVFRGEEKKTLSESLYLNQIFTWHYGAEVLFNMDCTQIMFSDVAGICFSQNGEDAVLVEPTGFVDVAFIDNSGTNNLFNVLFAIGRQDSESMGNLWYFTPEMKGVNLTSVQSIGRVEQVEDSVIVSGSSVDQFMLVYVKDIYSSAYEEKYLSSDEKIIPVLTYSFEFTSGKTILYGSELGVSMIQADEPTEPTLLTANCADMQLLKREGKPDIIYYLEYSEPDPGGDTDEQDHIAWYYYDLYMFEDSPGASPVLVAENVSNMWCGDFGVYYYQLESVAPKLREWLYSSVENPGDFTEDELYDQIKVYYSSNGDTFEYVTNVEVRHLYGG